MLHQPTPQSAVPEFGLSAPVPMRARRVFNSLVLQALDALPDTTAHNLPLTLLGRTEARAELATDLQTLSRTAFCWTDADQTWGVTSLLSYAGVQAGRIEYAFSPVLAQLLAQPQGRARIQLAMQQQISSSHSLALYELCTPWAQRGRSPWWPITQVRAALGCGDSAYYETFKHFNAKVLKPAAQDLAETSDLKIDLQTRREGRAVSALRFSVSAQPGVSVTDLTCPVDESRAQAMRAIGASEALAKLLAFQSNLGAETMPLAPAPMARKVNLRTRAARLAVIHRLTSQRTQQQQADDKHCFLNGLDDPASRQDFERFSWMSARNSTEILRFWQNRAPNAFAALRESREVDP